MEGIRFKQAWDTLLYLGITLILIKAPLDLAFSEEIPQLIQGSSIGLTLLFFVDLLVTFRHLRDKPAERKAYLRTWFIADLIAVVPWAVFGIPGLLRLVKLPKLLSLMSEYRIRHFRYLNTLRMASAIYWMLLVIHCIACGWHALRGQTPGYTPAMEYLDSVYWAIATLGTVGYGDITPNTPPEKIYAVFTMLAGIGFFSYLIGTIASTLSKTDPARVAYLANLDRLSTISRFHQFPKPLRQRLFEYYTYQYRKKRGYQDSSFMEGLPRSLENEVARFVKRTAVERVPLFARQPEDFLEEISQRLEPVFLTPHETLFEAGETGNRMYFIIYGQVEVWVPGHSHPMKHLGSGMYFGEIALFLDIERTATIRSSSFCDLYSLSKEDFEFITQRFPGISESIRQEMLHRVSELDQMKQQ